MDDNYFMKMALTLARMADGQTSPNPPVGAVVVKDGEIIGLGAHLKAGEAHAEVHALEMAGAKASGATIYVTLEPCSHEGRTPPCSDAIIAKGLKRVVIAMRDPNEKNDADSINKLKQAGIMVDIGVMQEEAEQLNRAFLHYMTKKRPFITVKTAATLDGKMATETGDSKWITGEEARKDVHRYRASHDAILVGVNTVINDNPALTARYHAEGKNPLRIILDTHLRTPLDSKVITDGEAETWIFTGNHTTADRMEKLKNYAHVTVIPLGEEIIRLDQVLNILWQKEIMTLFVEGGSVVHGAFLKDRLIDECIFYMAPKLLGGKHAYPSFGGTGSPLMMEDAWDMEINDVSVIGRDIRITAVPREDDKDVHRNH